MNPLRSDILAQGRNIQHVLNHLYAQERARLEAAAEFIQPEKPILLIGIASAAYLCIPAQVYLSQAGHVTRVMNASDALYHEWPALQQSNVVINSRSGETAEIVKLAQRLKSASIPFLAITNEPESPLARLTPHLLWANTHIDDLVSINVISGMMLTTLVWAAGVQGLLEQVRPSLDGLAEAVGATLARSAELAEAMAAAFSTVRPIYLLARGASSGAAACGRLVLEEVARRPAVALEGAEFRQGPNEVVDQNFGALLFIGHGETAALNRSLGKEIVHHGGSIVSIGTEEVLRDMPGMVFPLPRVPEAFSPILEVIPVQGLAYRLAEKNGLVPGTVRYITKIIKEETTPTL